MQNRKYNEVYFETENIFLPDENMRTHCIDESENTVLHSHEFTEIFYITKGSAVHVCNRARMTLTYGDLVLIQPRKDSHQFINLPDTPCTHRDIMFPSEYFGSVCELLGTTCDDLYRRESDHPTVFKLDLNTLYFLEQHINYILVTDLPLSAKKIEITALCGELIHLLGRTAKHPAVDLPDNTAPLWLNEFLALFTKADIIYAGLPELKKYLPYSYEHVERVFKKYTGQTIVQRLNKTRIDYAAGLLRSTDMLILSVAMSVGYNSLSHFNKLFKEYYEMTPLAYRKMHS